MSADLNLNISAMKVALGFAHDCAIRARCYTGAQRLLELEDLGRQLDKARALHSFVMRDVKGGRPHLALVEAPGK